MKSRLSAAILLWLLCALAPLAAGLAAWLGAAQASALSLSLVILPAAVLACALAAVLHRRLLAPLSAMAEGLARTSAGDYAADPAAAASGALGQAADLAAALTAALARLKTELGFARGILHGMATPFVVVDSDEVLRFTNANLLHLLQHEGRPEDFYGQNVAHFFYGDATRKTVLSTAMQERREITREVELTGRKGARRNIRIDASPVYDLSGALMGSLCVYADLSELRGSEARLLSQNQKIAAAAAQADAISRQMAEAAGRFAELVVESSRGAARQSARTAETATAMEEMNASVLEVAGNASSAAEHADQAGDKAREGQATVERAVAGIGEVARLTGELKKNLGSLGERAQAIGQIMNVIGDIADQTNLLALNAAIEAARAGDAGRGFAVVADEVRKLAEKTMTATKEVGEAVGAIQGVMRLSLTSMDEAAGAVDRSTSLASASGQVLSEIVAMVAATTDQVRAIAAAAEEQSATSEEIGRAVEDIRGIAEATSRDMGQAEGSVSQLTELAGELEGMIRAIRA
jgi:methyl-accepting chemotaxis protein